MPIPAELFLSHSDQDRDFAEALGAVLGRHGVPYWYSRRDLRGADIWHDEIGTALHRCDWFLLALSPAAIDSMWVKRELNFALRDPRYEGHIVPVLYQPCAYESLSWTLGAIERIDFTAGFDEGCRELLRIWGLGYRPA